MAAPQPTELGAESTLEEITKAAAQFLDSKRADDIKIIQVRDILHICTYFIIAGASSSRQLQALADGTDKLLKPLGLPRLGAEGYREGRWICLDYTELVVHLFENDSRVFYDFDHLYGDAPTVEFERAPDVSLDDSAS